MKSPLNLDRRRVSRSLCTTLGISLVLGIGAVSGAFADDTAKPAAGTAAQTPDKDKPAPKPITDIDYVIGVDDVIGITAVGHEEINQVVTVLSDGKIRVSGIDDDIKVEGMTLGELKKRIVTGLNGLYNNLNLTVAIRESHSKNVTIIGARSSGVFPIRKGMHVSNLIAIAGGLSGKLKLTTGILVRDWKTTRIALDKIVGKEPDPAADPLLEPNDQLILDTKEEGPPPAFNIVGVVQRPGSFIMPLDGTPVTLAQGLAQAGGTLTNAAALTKATLQRHGKTIPLNLYPLLVEGKADSPEGKMLLEDGDLIVVPEIQAKYMVLGTVNRPAVIPLPEVKNVTPLQAMAEAGGPAPNAELRKATLIRTVNGKQTQIPLDLMKMMTKADLSKNIPMQDGDVLYIPQKGHTFSLADAVSPLWILSTLGFRPFN